jgi:hypothetical protein
MPHSLNCSCYICIYYCDCRWKTVFKTGVTSAEASRSGPGSVHRGLRGQQLSSLAISTWPLLQRSETSAPQLHGYPRIPSANAKIIQNMPKTWMNSKITSTKCSALIARHAPNEPRTTRVLISAQTPVCFPRKKFKGHNGRWNPKSEIRKDTSSAAQKQRTSDTVLADVLIQISVHNCHVLRAWLADNNFVNENDWISCASQHVPKSPLLNVLRACSHRKSPEKIEQVHQPWWLTRSKQLQQFHAHDMRCKLKTVAVPKNYI